MSTEKVSSPLAMLAHWVASRGDKIWLRQPQGGQWITYTWRDADARISQMAAALQNLNLPVGSSIAIMSKNCAHWIMAELAIWKAGYVSVPLYPNLTGEGAAQILRHANARMLFVGKIDGWQKILPAFPKDLPLVALPESNVTGLKSWDGFAVTSQPTIDRTPSLDALAAIIYTSGTMGEPKGVMQTFQAFATCGRNIARTYQVTTKDRFFSYLPMSHIAERMLIEFGSIYTGAEISFADSLETFADNLKAMEPTIFLGVPRIWTRFQGGILKKMPQAKLDRLLGLPIVGGLIGRKIRKALGLNRVRIAFTGAAPISVGLQEWFKKLGITLMECYGMTENCAYSQFNAPGQYRFGSAGKSWPDVECRIGEASEIQMRGPGVMLGYYQAPELTTEMLTADGWLCTGDQGEFDQDGYLRITGRVKDLFKTSKGKYVAPSPIELKLSEVEHIEQVCVVGRGLSQPIALVVLTEVVRKQPDKTELLKQFEQARKDINKHFESHEHIAKIVVMPDPWSIEGGTLTPTLKVKRSAIEAKFSHVIDGSMQKLESVQVM